MFKHFICAAAVGIAAFITTPAAHAVTVSFPTEASIDTSNTGGDADSTGFFFFIGHAISDSFSGTGLSSISDMMLDLELDSNVLSQTLGFGLSVNGASVGTFDLMPGDAGVVSLSFGGLNIAGTGATNDDYTVSLFVNNPVLSGEGSVSFATDTEDGLTLLGEAIAVVPLPASLSLMLAGLGGILVMRRRRTT